MGNQKFYYQVAMRVAMIPVSFVTPMLALNH